MVISHDCRPTRARPDLRWRAMEAWALAFRPPPAGNTEEFHLMISLTGSIAPASGHPMHGPMLAELKRIFDLYQDEGVVNIAYVTEVYLGK